MYIRKHIYIINYYYHTFLKGTSEINWERIRENRRLDNKLARTAWWAIFKFHINIVNKEVNFSTFLQNNNYPTDNL